MKSLLLYSDGSELLSFIIGWGIFFIIGVFITRWVFGIGRIISNLEKQNSYSLVQVRLLKKMLINQGVAPGEIDEIIQKGNKENFATTEEILNELNKNTEKSKDIPYT